MWSQHQLSVYQNGGVLSADLKKLIISLPSYDLARL